MLNPKPWDKQKHKPIPKIIVSDKIMLDKELMVKQAKAQHHKPYSLELKPISFVYQKKPDDFDCSSYVLWLYFQQGFKIPRVSQWQWNYCFDFTGDPEIGDLFFQAPGQHTHKVNHVGLYIGQGMCAEAAGGRAGKVIFTFKDRLEKKHDFLGWRRVPLEISQNSFFKFLKEHPPTDTQGNMERLL